MAFHMSTLRARLFSFDATHVWIALLLIALRPLIVTISPEDFWWHMAMGRYIVQTGQVPVVDIFSFTQAGKPYFVQNWLAEAALFAQHQLGGIELILLVQALVITFTYGLLLWLAIRRSGQIRLSVALLMLGVVPAVFDNWMVRPQSYVLPIFAAFLLILTNYRLGHGPRCRPCLWLLPPLMVLWVNMHGSFVLGLVLIALTFIGECIRRRYGSEEVLTTRDLRNLVLCGILTTLAMFANPRGMEVLDYVRALVGTPAVAKLVTEWASPLVTRSFSDLWFVALAIALIPIFYFSRKRPDITDFLMMLPFLYLAISSGRHIIWFTMIALPPLAVAVAPWFPKPAPSKENPTLNMGVVALVGMLVIAVLPWFKPSLGLPPELGELIEPRTPVRAVAALQKLPANKRPQRMYNTEGNGSYLIWAAPERKVFIDPRFEFYPFQQWADSADLRAGKNIDKIIKKYRLDGMLLNNQQDRTLLRQMQQRPKQWQTVYRDKTMTVLKKMGR